MIEGPKAKLFAFFPRRHFYFIFNFHQKWYLTVSEFGSFTADANRAIKI